MEFLSDHEFNHYILTEPQSKWILLAYIRKKLNYEQFLTICDGHDQPPLAAQRIVSKGVAEFEWAVDVIQNAKSGDRLSGAFLLYLQQDSKCRDSEWIKRVFESETGERYSTAKNYAEVLFSGDEWFEKVFGDK